MIKLTDVTKTYNPSSKSETTPVRDFCLDIKTGETIILKGASGCGKSTLLSLIAAMIRPTSGTIAVGDRIISKLPEHFSAEFRRGNIGMIFQKFHLIPGMSLAENICLPLLPTSLSTDDIMLEAQRLMKMLNIASLAENDAETLSGGEMQRGAIARALINNPPVILADEPTANLDKKLTDDFIAIVKDLKQQGKTIIIATHDEILAECGVADRIICMTKGG
jgi:putative ABC transport system ATP-binding protein